MAEWDGVELYAGLCQINDSSPPCTLALTDDPLAARHDQDAVPPPVESLVRTLLPPMVPVDDPLRSSHWQNVTGFWNGSATFYNLSAPPSSLPSLWAPLAEEIAQSINQTEAREDLGAWSWDGIETTSFRINDVVALGFDEIQSVSVRYHPTE